MNTSIAISVIIPVYNTESYLAECIDSVIAQTFRNIEIICVNDGSTDRSAEILERYIAKDNRIKVIHQENSGVVIARNNAIFHAAGQYLFLLDSDDKIASDCLLHLFSVISENNDCAVAYPRCYFFGDQSGEMSVVNPSKFNMSIANRVIVSALFDKSYFFKYGGFDLNFNKIGYEDWDFWLNFVFDNRKFCFVSSAVFYYRVQYNISRNQITAKYARERMKILLRKYPQINIYRFIYRVKKMLFRVFNKSLTT